MKQLSDYNEEYAREATGEIVNSFRKVHTFTGIEKEFINNVISRAVNKGMLKAIDTTVGTAEEIMRKS